MENSGEKCFMFCLSQMKLNEKLNEKKKSLRSDRHSRTLLIILNMYMKDIEALG